MFRRISLRLNTLKEESSIAELRTLLMDQVRQKAAPVDVLDTETRLVLLLSQCPSPENRREALMRAEHVWDVIHSPQAIVPNSSKIGMRVSLCTTLRRCAASLQDTELTELWTSRFDNRREKIQMKDFETYYRPPPPNAAGTHGDSSTDRLRKQTNLIDDADDEGEGPSTFSSSSSSNAQTLQQQQQKEAKTPKLNETENSAWGFWSKWGGGSANKKESAERNKKKKQKDDEAAEREEEAAQKRRMAMSPMQQMREDMMMQDHPMVLGIMKPKKPPGPRWT